MMFLLANLRHENSTMFLLANSACEYSRKFQRRLADANSKAAAEVKEAGRQFNVKEREVV